MLAALRQHPRGRVGAIDEYIDALGRRMSGPGRLRRDMLAEARDGLEDSTEEFVAAGLTRPEAEHAAVAEFGPVRVVAPQFQQELAVHQGRRTGLVLMVAFPCLFFAWDVLWNGVAAPPGGVPVLVYLLARLNDLVLLGLAGVGAAAVLGLTRWGRRLVPSTAVVTWFGALTLAGLVFTAVACQTMIALNADQTSTVTAGPLGTAVNVVSWTVIAWASVAAIRSIRLSRRIVAAGRHD